MTKITSVQSKAAPPKGSEYPWSVCCEIQSGEEELTPEEQQLEITRRAIWRKLTALPQFSSQRRG